ncbi:MAG: YihY family inner membrane protein [Corynebacterium flavescens]|uniref:YhjD/YihY/BrkB family envelope integrity protein n=1 Tax=Corynebacterium flavescens TaxID=28028 RepID=UPI0026484B7D|nr:YhjD/YihY/BrkB family envelope integrity protein [Corynebacterium flavescens]MDN6199238.1 YihY family inner membrane protein [Corynebacterium flavescens]MDN6225689.1 YihY family inner membrane protein [Corynebacterium flavescens]MDN6551898.1 YihY family inner membrane protein [Corynebacterium flavescens]
MATTTQSDASRSDEYGIERTHADKPGPVEKVRERSPFVDHLLRMNDRYSGAGGNQYAAGITYYSVLAIFPLLMIAVATAATVLAARPDLFDQLQGRIAESVSGELGGTLNGVLETAVAQRGAMFGVGGLTTLWSGLGWMGNLRIGISAMWGIDPNDGGGFVRTKISDFLGLVGLLVALAIAFGVTVAGTSGLSTRIFDLLGIESFPGSGWVVFLIGLVAGLIANFLVVWWMLVFLPRTRVPLRSGLIGAVIGAVALEILKQASTLIMSSAAGNPAGAVFGPVIVLMVVMYLLWRVVLYVSAWTATTEESLELVKPPVPEPAVIRVRNEIKKGPPVGLSVGAGAALGALAAGLLSLRGRK